MRISRWRVGAAAALAMLPIGAGRAQAPADMRGDPPDAIIVDGARLSPGEARRQATDFVRRIGVIEGDKPAARWAEGICPHVTGLDDRYAVIVADRVRAIARAAKVPVARAGCDSNIVISFVADARATVQAIATRAPGALDQVPIARRDQLRNGGAPIRWWYATAERTARGQGDFGGAPGWTGGNNEGGGSMLPAGLPAYGQYSSSTVSTQMTRILRAATVVVDMKAVDGLPLDSVAAFAALVALAEIRPADPPPAGSILAMFGAGETPRTLTDRDESFLRSLYRLPLDRGGRRHRGLLVRDIAAAAAR